MHPVVSAEIARLRSEELLRDAATRCRIPRERHVLRSRTGHLLARVGQAFTRLGRSLEGLPVHDPLTPTRL